MAAKVPAEIKKTLAMDSCVNTINIDASVTPVKIEYAMNNAVAVLIDIELILAEISQTRPSCAINTINRKY